LVIGEEAKLSEELPDLTPYLSKKGGNQSNKGPAEAASKPELSQKLSALVKKPVASSHHESQQPSSTSQAGASAIDSGANANSFIPTIRPVTSSSASHPSLEAVQSQVGQSHSTPVAHSLHGSGDSSISGVQSTRALSGKQIVSPVDRLRGPQARPITSLSSGNAAPPHLLKAPSQPQPQQQLPERNAGTRAEGDSLPTPAIFSPRPVAPSQAPIKPVSRASEAPATQGQSQVGTASAANLSRSVAPLQMPAGFAGLTGAGSHPQSSGGSSASQSAGLSQEQRGASSSAPSSSSTQGLDSKEMLARAFQEEQRALEKEKAAAADAPKNFADLFNQESKLLKELGGAGVSQESDPNAVLYSDSDHLPHRSVGIGNLLGGTDASLPPQHTAFSDLMTRTGEHDVHFAPERREELSNFDEVKSSIQASINPPVSQPRPIEKAPDRPSEGAAFNLFSTEIVTSGQDYHTRPEPEGGDFGVGMRDSDSTYPASSAACDLVADNFSRLSESSSQVLANYAQGLAGASSSTSSSSSGDFSAEVSGQFSPESYEQSAPLPFQQFGAAFPMQPASESFAQFEAEASQEPEPSFSSAGVVVPAAQADPSSFDPKAFNLQVADPAQAEAAREVMAQLMAFQTGGSQSQAVQSLDQLKAAIKAKKDEEARAQEMEAEFNRQQQQRALQDSDQLEAPAKEPVAPVVPVAEDEPNAQRAKLIAMIEQSNQAKLDAVEGTERAVNASVPEPEGALGRALSNALDKLLGDDDTPFGAPPASPQVEANAVVAQAQAPSPMSFESETTVKADALARLLEVASKAPSKAPEANKTKSSAINLAEIINKPPGKVSRQMEAAQHASGNPESMASPFGGNSPYTSPFAGGGSMASDSSNNPSASGQNLNAGYSSQPGAGYSSAGSQQANMSSDAVSARMADLNRKLQEQRTKPVVTSSQTVEAMSPVDMPPLSSEVGVASSPSINSLGQIPAMDEEVGSKAELVNRILGQARITGAAAPAANASMSNLPKSSVDYMGADQAAAVRNIKPQAVKTQLSNRSRMAGPGIHPAVIGLVVLLVLGIVGGGGYYLYQSGILKGELPKGVGSVEKSIDALIKDGEYDQAIVSLESKQKSTKLSSSELDKLYSTYINQADRLAKEDEEFGKAVALLEKVPSKTKRYKEAQKMLRKYRKKVKKN
jgi:hypothetical protein